MSDLDLMVRMRFNIPDEEDAEEWCKEEWLRLQTGVNQSMVSK